jgi:hypothetical protein
MFLSYQQQYWHLSIQKIVVSILTVVFFPGYMYVFVWAYGHNTGNPIIAGIITAVIFAIYLKFMPNERYEIIKPYLKSCSPKGKNQVEAARQIWNLYNASRYHQQLVLIYTLLIALLAVESLLFLILIDIFCLAFLISCAVLLLGYCKKEFNLDLPDLYFTDCFGKEWQETVCPICGTIGCNNLGSANYKNGSYTAERVFGTKTSDVTVEGETYHVKQNTSDILIHEHYSYDKIYYCPNCKKKYEKHHSGRVQVL